MEDGWLLGDESLVNSTGYSLWNSPVALSDLCGSGLKFFTTEITDDHRGKLTLTSLCALMNRRRGRGFALTARSRLWTDRRRPRPGPAPRAGCTARTPESGAAFLPCAHAFAK